MSKPVQYIKCPRCELNYILKKDKFCDVCKAEMKAGILEENELEDMDEGLMLCPICKVNYIQEGETMCASCQEEQADSTPKDDEPDWRGFVDKTDDEDEELDLLPTEEDDEIDEELEGAFAKDLDNEFDDDLEEEDDDESNSDEDDDFDDDDDEENEDDDDEDDDDDLYKRY